MTNIHVVLAGIACFLIATYHAEFCFREYLDRDMPGVTIVTVRDSSFDRCSDECGKTAECAAFVLQSSRTCVLKRQNSFERQLVNVVGKKFYEKVGCSIVDYAFLGCYDENDQVFSKVADSAVLDLKTCIETCGELDHPIAAARRGNQCWCAEHDSLGGQRRDNTQCSVPCGGNGMQHCGGLRKLAVYSTLTGGKASTHAVDQSDPGVPPVTEVATVASTEASVPSDDSTLDGIDSRHISQKPPRPTPCPSRWRTHGGHCYLYEFNAKHTFSQARKECLDHKADLVKIDDADENEFIASLLGSVSGWIGYQQDKTGVNRWLVDSSEATFESWAEGEKADTRSRMCARVTRYGQWYRAACDASSEYFCEME